MKPVKCFWCDGLLQDNYILGTTLCAGCGKVASVVISEETTIQELANKFAAKTGVGVEVRIQGTEYGPVVAIVPIEVELQDNEFIAVPTKAITWYRLT